MTSEASVESMTGDQRSVCADQEDFAMALTCFRRGDLTDAQFCRVMRRIGIPDRQIEHLVQQFNSEAA